MVTLSSRRETIKCKRVCKVLNVDIYKSNLLTYSYKGRIARARPISTSDAKTQCLQCIGDDALSVEERAFSYCRSAVIDDHFSHEHLE